MTASSRPANRILVLFGASGDLAARKLFPGLLHLDRQGLMPEDYRIIGSGRHSPGSDDEFRETVADALQEHAAEDVEDQDAVDAFLQRISFVVSSADDGADLRDAVTAAEEEVGADGDRLLYLSVPPGAMKAMVGMLGETGLADGAALVVEKPFGMDVPSAQDLNAALHDVLEEEQIYRIDHFLGKEAAQNILAFRFANGLFEPVWNRDHIAYVQIDVPEDLDIAGRAAFYEETGAFRDMIVTHLMQLMALVALEPPTRLESAALHAERTKLFDAIRPLDPAQVVFGQYEGYRDEDDVADDSTRETFAALEVRIDSWRWHGVPFLLRTGKAMATSSRTITVGFRDAPLQMFPLHETGDDAAGTPPTEVVFDLSEDPTIGIDLLTKVPGPTLELARATMRLDVEEELGGAAALEAYARLLHDVMLGERLLFTRAEQIERLWEICQPVLDDPPEALPYPRGSWGPDAAQDLAGPRGWRLQDDGS
ncbi:Glucose-6-phosphate 1-dehydrogenase 2 [Paraconexibacter sp. AEG42_29]|uniref:Glucose-6-phosphate 1-dehydrogenase n=1 Tax=Paraconexibacter sp. AEG42_29 TaxID=2997339 RepID=A0AAU7ATV7_9ACTN